MAEDVATIENAGIQERSRWFLRIAIGLLVLGVVSNLVYLWVHCPVDLSEDESHYWEWSRHLDYGYYSKPPGIAWIMWLTLQVARIMGITGDESGTALMPVLRSTAVILGLCSGLLSLFLTRRIFRDNRAALVVIVLSAAVPMFAVGSLLITIDSPMYLCWAATVFCLWRALEASEEWSETRAREKIGFWMTVAGLCCAVGMLFKPVLIAIPPCVVIAGLIDRRMRRVFFTAGGVRGLVLVALSQVPVVLWNSQHRWVTFRHIATQGGMGAPRTAWYAAFGRLGEYLGGQAAGMGGIMFVLLVIAVVEAWRWARRPVAATQGMTEASARKDEDRHLADATRWRFLLAFTVPLWGFYLVMNLWKKTEVNWPAASYFTGMILLAGVFTAHWNAADAKERRGWRTWGTIAIAWGFLMAVAAMNTQRFYPLIAHKLQPLQGTEAYYKSALHPLRWDQPTVRLRGMQARAEAVEAVRKQMEIQTGRPPLIITGRYGTSSSLSFYMPGHPFVYCIMSSVGERQNQYDLWPGLNEKAPDGSLLNRGQPAVIVGAFSQEMVDKVLRPAFERVEGPEKIPMSFMSVDLRELWVYRAYDFKGLPEIKGDTY